MSLGVQGSIGRRGGLPAAVIACDRVCTMAPPKECPPKNMLLLLLFIACISAFSDSATAICIPGGTGTPPRHCGRATHSCNDDAAEGEEGEGCCE
jgi:hypothetical protein